MKVIFFPFFAEVEGVSWPSAIVAVALLALVAAIMIYAMRKYDIDGAIKIWGLLGVIVGIMTGTFGTYFFTRQEVQAQKTLAGSQVSNALAMVDYERDRANSQVSNAVALAAIGPQAGHQAGGPVQAGGPLQPSYGAVQVGESVPGGGFGNHHVEYASTNASPGSTNSSLFSTNASGESGAPHSAPSPP
jgi:hypothetical protein